MLVVFKNIKQDNILVFDAEYNEGDLIQFAGILFRKLEKDIFQIYKSINFYVKLEKDTKINYFIERFTGITDEYLEEEGIELSEAIEKIDELLNEVNNVLIVSHGLYNDRLTLENNGIDFYQMDQCVKGLCTYNMAKRVLKRDKNLSLENVANEAGIFLSRKHNAFDDTWATVAVLSLLSKLDAEEQNEKNLL